MMAASQNSGLQSTIRATLGLDLVRLFSWIKQSKALFSQANASVMIDKKMQNLSV